MSTLFCFILSIAALYFFFPVSIVEWAKAKAVSRATDWKSIFPKAKVEVEDFVIAKKAKKQD